MTIAAGFVYRDGVLLCSDTQHEAGAMKVHAPKMGVFEWDGGKLAFALAGNSSFATSAIQKCYEKLLAKKAAVRSLSLIESALDKEYRRTIYAHPDRSTDWTLPYWFLIALWEPDQRVSLFASEQVTLRSVTDAECIGIGRDLANYLVRSVFSTEMSEQDAQILAAYMLARVKDHVPGCGGVSQFLSMRNDGSFNMLDAFELDQFESFAGAYDDLARRLLFDLANDQLSDAVFKKKIREFNSNVKELRFAWRIKFSAMWSGMREGGLEEINRRAELLMQKSPIFRRPTRRPSRE